MSRYVIRLLSTHSKPAPLSQILSYTHPPLHCLLFFRWYTTRADNDKLGAFSDFNLWTALFSYSLKRVHTLWFVRLYLGREDWMIYRGPGCLAVVWFGSTPTLSSRTLTARCLSFSLLVCRPVELTDVRRGEGGGGGEKVWSSVSHSILSAPWYTCQRQGSPRLPVWISPAQRVSRSVTYLSRFCTRNNHIWEKKWVFHMHCSKAYI